VFLDEPTTGLDPQGRRSLWEIVRRLKAGGTTVLLTTHYMEEAEELCDRVAIMDHGRFIETGTVPELIGRHFRERAVRFDTLAMIPRERLGAFQGVRGVASDDSGTVLYTADVAATIGDLLAVAGEAGVEPRNLAISQPSLEDVFLELTGHALRD
jgi:ABC-2 type transport system ATP-binding protein